MPVINIKDSSMSGKSEGTLFERKSCLLPKKKLPCFVGRRQSSLWLVLEPRQAFTSMVVACCFAGILRTPQILLLERPQLFNELATSSN